MSPESDADGRLIEETLAMARAGEVIEVFIENTLTRTVTVADGEAESTEDQQEHGAAVRLFRDGRVGFSFTADLSSDGLAAAVESARALSSHTRREDANQPPTGRSGGLVSVADGGAVATLPVDLTDRLDVARRVESAAKKHAGGRGRTRSSVAVDAAGEVAIANSGGLLHRFDWTRSWAFLELVVERDGKLQVGYESDWAANLSGIDPERIGVETARQAMTKFGATRPDSGAATVVLDPRVTAGLFETLSSALSAKSVLRRRSLFADRVGKTVASAAVTLIDDGTLQGGFATEPVDGEGSPSTRAYLIRAGKLEGYLHDTYTATHMGVPSTGHSVRDGYTSAPGVGPRNFHLEPSGITRADLLAGVDEGIYVDEVMGLHTIDPVSGDFSLGATGRSIAGGTLQGALEGFVIAGNVLPMLRSVVAVADDLRFFPGSGGGSTVLLQEVQIGGR